MLFEVTKKFSPLSTKSTKSTKRFLSLKKLSTVEKYFLKVCKETVQKTFPSHDEKVLIILIVKLTVVAPNFQRMTI